VRRILADVRDWNVEQLQSLVVQASAPLEKRRGSVTRGSAGIPADLLFETRRSFQHVV
jgi:hypothetical protein